MHEWMQNLLTLQERDVRMAQIEAQLKAVPGDKQKAEAELKAEEQLTAAAKDAVKTAEKAIKALELDAESIRTRMRDFQSKSAMIKNNEEYKAALHQVEVCKQQIGEIEDRELKAMEDLERAKHALVLEEKKVAAARQRIAEVLADLDTRARNCKQEVDKMAAARAELLNAVPEDVRARYERVRTSRAHQDPNHRAFVGIRNGTCGGCHMNVQAQLRVNALKGQLAACANCGRLLYVEE